MVPLLLITLPSYSLYYNSAFTVNVCFGIQIYPYKGAWFGNFMGADFVL